VCAGCHTTQAHGKHPHYEDQPTAKEINGAKLTVCDMALLSTLTASTAAHARSATQYSVKTCGGCHYDQYTHWRVERHADLIEGLPTKYVHDQSCTGCHSTTGAIASAASENRESPGLRVGISCESCHGPAYQHVRFNRQFINGPPLNRALEQAARGSIRQGKPQTTCIQCHVGHRHKEHPPFDKQ
jgi:hypothetical protein